MTGTITSSLVQNSFFHFDGREVRSVVTYRLNEGQPEAIVEIIDNHLNYEFANSVITFRWFEDRILLKPESVDDRFQAVINAVCLMLLDENVGCIENVF